jgi:hypothetical protein
LTKSSGVVPSGSQYYLKLFLTGADLLEKLKLSILNWFALLNLLLIKLTEELAKVDEKLKLTESLLETRVIILLCFLVIILLLLISFGPLTSFFVYC